MPTTHERKIAIDLSVEEIEKRLTAVEQKGLPDDGKKLSVNLLELKAARIEDTGEPGNLAIFEEPGDGDADSIIILTGVPADAREQDGFFSKIQQRGLDVLCYADLYISGTKQEAVTCRANAENAPPAPPAEPVPTPAAPVPTPTAPAPVDIPTAPAAPGGIISEEAFKLIVESEGFDRPSRWPGHLSGITLGVGYDLGYMTEAEFREDWSGCLESGVIGRLTRAIGVTGQRARAMASSFEGIQIPKEGAMKVFKSRTIPRYRKMAFRAFPGMEKLPLDTQGGLISLVFNRGPGMKGSSRAEMRNIREDIGKFRDGDDMEALQKRIAIEIRKMKRLWANKGLNGLLVRRDREAALVA